ncbi:hypothetical protein KAH81_09855 [bacterium]|nr:hypothetical protein [bacterium]
MRSMIFSIMLFSAVAFSQSDSLWNCIVKSSIQLAPTQSTTGNYSQISGADSSEGRFFYEPPHATFFTIDDSVYVQDFFSLKDPWFDWWIQRDPAIYPDMYSSTKVKDSLSFAIYEHHSLSPKFANVRTAYDRGTCELYSAYFYWPVEAGHGFPGADAIYYEFYVTDRMVLTPTLRIYFNKRGEPVETVKFMPIGNVADTPLDSVIIEKLLSNEPFD